MENIFKPTVFVLTVIFLNHANGLEHQYRSTCPEAEKIVQNALQNCFIAGCDTSLLLDDKKPEKHSTPNCYLKGYDIVDLIKSQVEQICPGIVSCADIAVLAAREGVVQAGGPFHPLFTGRRETTQSFSYMTHDELPSPHADHSNTLASFASRGFHERKFVCLLGMLILAAYTMVHFFSNINASFEEKCTRNAMQHQFTETLLNFNIPERVFFRVVTQKGQLVYQHVAQSPIDSMEKLNTEFLSEWGRRHKVVDSLISSLVANLMDFAPRFLFKISDWPGATAVRYHYASTLHDDLPSDLKDIDGVLIVEDEDWETMILAEDVAEENSLHYVENQLELYSKYI